MTERKALSLRQPWAWLVVEGIKPVENRVWTTKYRGPFYVHAAKGMTRQEYADCAGFCAARTEGELPPFDELYRGGIVGVATLINVLPPPRGNALSGAKKWQMDGQYGFQVTDPRRLPFTPCRGALGFWSVPESVVRELEGAK